MTWPLTDLQLKILAALGALIAFLVGLWQYRKGQKWQKAQIILNLIDAFKEDQYIQAACLMLDWDQREIIFSDGRRIAFNNAKLPAALQVMYMDDSSIVPSDKAMVSGVDSTNGNCGFSPEETLVRDCFDRFFDFFDKLHAFRTNDLVELSDLRYFFYWFELVRVIGQYKNDVRIQETVNKYVSAYNFRGFAELSKEYASHPEPLLPSPADR